MAEVCGLDVPPPSDLPVTVEVDATKTGSDETLTAVALYGDNTAEVQVEEREPKMYKLTFHPPQKDKYTLEMKWGENHIKGSPLNLDLRAPNAKAVTIAEPPVGKLRAGQLIKICFDTSNAGRGEMHSSCNGEEVGEIKVDVQRRDFTNKFDVTFQPPREDEYVVHVKWSLRSVKGSPFKIDLIPVNPNKVKASTPKIPANPDDPIEMDISTKGAGNAKLTATCMGQLGGKIPVSIKKVTAHDYHLTVKPPERDILSLSVQYGGKHIPNSPFLVNTLPVDASKVEVTEPENPDIGQAVSYKLNTLHAGAGTLSASCEGERSGPVDIEIKQEGSTKNKHVAIFTPNGEDVYTVGIKWGDENTPLKDVPGSPFTVPLLLPADASKVKTGDLHVPEGAGEDEWVWLELDCSEAGHGEVTAEAKHENGVSVEVDIKPIDDNNKYCVKFKSDQPGKYNLAVFYGGKPIPGSPYSDIEILDLSPKPDKVKLLKTKQPEERGGAAVLLFDAKEAGKGEFRARVAGLRTSHIEHYYELVPGSNEIYTVSFSPHLADKYLIDVYWDDHAIPKSPFFVEIVYPDEVIVTPPSEDSITLKNPCEFRVDTTKAGPGKLTAKCEIRESGKEVKAVVAKRPKEAMKFTVSVNPDEECVYSVSILFNEHHVKGSPFDINLVPKLVNESQSMSPITNEEVIIIDLPAMSPPPKAPETPPLPTELQMFIGEPFSCVIGPENSEQSDNMTATAVGMKTGPVEIVRKQNEEDLPCFFFNPDVADKYAIEIRTNGAVIPGNSFIVDYIYPVDASKCVIFGADGLSEKLTINETISFGVDASRAGNGKLSVNVDGPSSLSQPIEVSVTSTEENPNVYHISYLPTARGKHSINLQWAGEPIPDSPVVLDVDSSDDIPTLFINEPFVIHFTTDCDPKEIKSYAIHEDTCHRYVLKIGKRKGGKLNLILYAKELGIHSVHILIGGKEIHGSPYNVLFIESDSSACKIVDIPKKPPIGMETSFKVDARNAGYGDLHIKAKVPHSGRTDITHVDHKNGTYSVVLTPTVPGNHTFQVSWAGAEIPDSPVVMEVVPAGPDLLASLEAASRVYIVKEYMPIFSDVLSILEPAVFHLSTKHAGKGQLTIRATGPYEARIKVVDQNDGTYKCDVHPKVSGKYLISILWNDFSIPGSPFHLNFTDGKSHMIHGFKLETDYFTIGTPREYIIDCGKEQGSLKVDCHPKEVADVELTQVEGKDDTYLCKVIPQIVGNHEIHVTYNEKHILNSPYIVQFYDSDHREHQQDEVGEDDQDEDRLSSLGSLNLGGDDQENDHEVEYVPMSPNPAMVKVFGLKSSGYVGQEGNFRIETAEAGDGKLEVNVRGPKGTFQINMRHHPDSDRTILARYDPKHASEYTIDITWSGSPIPHSPFVVNILEQHPLIQSFEL